MTPMTAEEITLEADGGRETSVQLPVGRGSPGVCFAPEPHGGKVTQLSPWNNYSPKSPKHTIELLDSVTERNIIPQGYIFPPFAQKPSP